MRSLAVKSRWMTKIGHQQLFWQNETLKSDPKVMSNEMSEILAL